MSHSPDDSPYAPPASHLSVPERPVSERIAGRGRRFANFLIDQLAVGLLTGFVVGARGGDPEVIPLGESLIAVFSYYVVLESAFGVTLGKLVTRTRVVRENGRRADPLRVALRTASRFIPLEPLSLLLSGAEGPVAWHDSLSGTRVTRLH